MATLTEIRALAAKEAGRFVTGTSTTGGTTTTQITTALISSLSQNDLYADWWLYLPTASAGDKVRVVTSYTPSTGTLTLDRAYSGATVPNSKLWELHGMVRPFADDLTETMDWTQLINDGLKRCFVEVEFTHTPVANQTRHDLTTLNTWLTNPMWIREVGSLVSGEARLEVDPYRARRVRGRAQKMSNIVYIEHPGTTFQSNQTIYVKAIKPAYYHCAASGGAYGSQATGLALESDIAEPRLEWVAYAALVEFARRGLGPADAQDDIRRKEQRWADLYTYYTQQETKDFPSLKFSEKLMVGVLGQHTRWR